MVVFFIKRLLMSLLVVLISTIIMYYLVDWAIDPLQDLRTSTAPNKAEQMARRSAELHLDDSVFSRYVSWLKGASGCLYGNCDLNQNWHTHEAVTALLSGAVLTTIKLVGAATVVAIVLGVFVGIISALRQYTGFDYSITFLSFLMYSLPVFWVAVLAKVFLAIRFNDFLAAPSPALSVGFIAVMAGITALAVAAAVAGNWRIRLRNFAIVAAGRGGAVPVRQPHQLLQGPAGRHRADHPDLRGLGLRDHRAEHRPAQQEGPLLGAVGRGPRRGALPADALLLAAGRTTQASSAGPWCC